jgi:hypothetical protein
MTTLPRILMWLFLVQNRLYLELAASGAGVTGSSAGGGASSLGHVVRRRLSASRLVRGAAAVPDCGGACAGAAVALVVRAPSPATHSPK